MSGIVLVAKPSFIFCSISGNETLDHSFNVDISNKRLLKNDTGNLKHEVLDWKLWIDIFTPKSENKPKSFSLFLDVITVILEDENENYYSIGVAIALSNAIIGSLCAIIASRVSFMSIKVGTPQNQ